MKKRVTTLLSAAVLLGAMFGCEKVGTEITKEDSTEKGTVSTACVMTRMGTSLLEFADLKYDDQNRLIEVNANTDKGISATYDYSQPGKIVKISKFDTERYEHTIEETFTLDDKGRVVHLLSTFSDGSPTLENDFEYNEEGYLTTNLQKAGKSKITATYEYKDGNLVKITTKTLYGNMNTDITYDTSKSAQLTADIFAPIISTTSVRDYVPLNNNFFGKPSKNRVTSIVCSYLGETNKLTAEYTDSEKGNVIQIKKKYDDRATSYWFDYVCK